MTTVSHPKYSIFISHNHKDDAFGHRLVEDLRNELNKLNDDSTVWYDSKAGRSNSLEGLRPGDNWQRVIRERLMRSNIFIVLLSKSANRSKWVKDEIEIARPRCVAKRLRIITIRLDNCVVPADLNLYQVITYTSPSDYKRVFDVLLQGLGLQSASDDPDGVLVQQVMRQIEGAFATQDWLSVIQNVPTLVKHFPQTVQSAIYHMQSIALLELGRILESRNLLDQALILEMDEKVSELLRNYINLLKEKDDWAEILYRTERVLQKLPDDLIWLQLQMFAKGELEKKENEKKLFHMNSANFSTYQKSSQDTASIIVEPSGLYPDTDPITGYHSVDSTSTDVMGASDLANLQADTSRSKWSNFETLTDLHVPSHKVKDIFSSVSSRLACFFNILGLFLIASLWDISKWVICSIALVVMSIFILGRLKRWQARGLFLALFVSIFWWACGWGLGQMVMVEFHKYHILQSDAQTSLMIFLFALACGFWGFSWHEGLFRRPR